MPRIEGKELKKSIVISCKRNAENDYSSKNGTLYAFDVVLKNGDTGTYYGKNIDNPLFKVDEEATYFVDTITSDKNPEWKRTNLRFSKPFEKTSGGSWKRSPEETKSIIYQVATSELYELGINNIDIISETFIANNIKEVSNYVINKVFEQEETKRRVTSIEYCSAIKIACKILTFALKKKTVEIHKVTSDVLNKKIEDIKINISNERFTT